MRSVQWLGDHETAKRLRNIDPKWDYDIVNSFSWEAKTSSGIRICRVVVDNKSSKTIGFFVEDNFVQWFK